MIGERNAPDPYGDRSPSRAHEKGVEGGLQPARGFSLASPKQDGNRPSAPGRAGFSLQSGLQPRSGRRLKPALPKASSTEPFAEPSSLRTDHGLAAPRPMAWS